MFTKNNVSQSLVDAVKNIIGEASPVKEPTATGMKVYGRSYGNSAKAKQDQTKSSVDDLKGPKTKDLLQKDKEDHMKTKGRYDEELKGDQHKIDANKNKKIDAHDFAILRGKKKVAEELNKNEKEAMKKAASDKEIKHEIAADRIEQKQKNMMKKSASDKSVKEELKGDQHKIDANKNNKVDAHDFAILRGKKKVKEDMHFAKKLIEGIKRSDVPAYVRKARGDAPLTPAEVKSGSKDSISDPKNLAKARNEEVESLDEVSLKTATSAYVKRVGRDETGADPKAAKTIQHIANRYGVKGVARAAKIADMEYGLNDPVHNKRKDFVKSVMSGVKEEIEQIDEKDPCWANYTQVGMKKKNGREVPNCVPSKGVPAAKGYKKEEVELDEKEMTSADKTERERIVKGMKKGLSGFKARYGARAKDVMYATATKQAMKEAAEDSSAITTDTLIGRMPGGKSNDFKSYKIRVRPLDKEGEHQPKDATPIAIQPDDTPARKSHETKQSLKLKEGKRPETDDAPPFEGPYTKIPSNVKDKSGAVHTPMSRARNLAQAAMKKLKTEMMGKLGTSESKK
jgi:hypothetical protein